MAVLNNKNFLEVSGAFTGTVNTIYRIVVQDDSGTMKYKWKKLEDTGTWTSFSSLSAFALDTNYTIDNGVIIKFTRTTLAQYNHNDKWTFTAYAHLKLSEIEGNYKYIQTLDESETRNLIAITDSGKTSVITGIDTDNPTVSSNTGVDIGESVSDFDFVQHNKELYIAKGIQNPPRWLGYTSNAGMAGQTEIRLKSAYAMDVLSEASRAASMAFKCTRR